jgi:hypothetical protein
MYWKDIRAGYYWYQAPIETQSLLIEAFQEIGGDQKTVDDLRTWLLAQKQVQRWGTTKATADACYALLLEGSSWLSNNPSPEILLGTTDAGPAPSLPGEQDMGYFKKRIDPPFIKPEMGNVTVSLKTPVGGNLHPAWGAIYWQYFEDLDRITRDQGKQNGLKLEKKIFIRKNADRGTVLEPVHENDYLKIGDRVTVRLELRIDRDMEYVHLKDMRAACMEPVNVLSGYKWQDGLGYYESTRDASTNFFFSSLPKGTYVLEYDLFVSQSGTYSNGIATIQCMYAPEFSSHSEGIKVNVENRE